MIKLSRSGWGSSNSIVIADQNDIMVRIYPNSLNSNIIGVVSGTQYGAISPAFRDSNGDPQGLSFSINKDYYEVRFSELKISDNTYSNFSDAAIALDILFSSQ
jgi:hypothetical protein